MVRFLTVAQPHRLYALLRLAFETGMRRGELLGLHWDDIDFLRHKIYVRHNLVKAGKALHLYDTKSESGDRDIDLDHAVTELLREHRFRQDDEREK
jgi:integrase